MNEIGILYFESAKRVKNMANRMLVKSCAHM